MQKIPVANFAARFIAMRSLSFEGVGRVSQLVLQKGVFLYDPRRIRTLTEAMARYYAVDLTALRQRCSLLLHGRNYLPLPLTSALVLVPLPLGQGAEKTGYINLLAVKGISPQGRNCQVHLEDDVSLDCCMAAASARNRLLKARLALRELNANGMLANPDENWRQKLEVIRAVLTDK